MIKEILTTGFIFFCIAFLIYGAYLKFLRDKLFEDVIHYTEGKPDYIERKRIKNNTFLFLKLPKNKDNDELIEKIKERMSYDINTLSLSIEETKQKLIKEGWKRKTVRRAIKLLKQEIKENGLKTKIEGFTTQEGIPEPPRPTTSTTDSGEISTTSETTRSSGATNRFETRGDRELSGNRFKITR